MQGAGGDVQGAGAAQVDEAGVVGAGAFVDDVTGDGIVRGAEVRLDAARDR